MLCSKECFIHVVPILTHCLYYCHVWHIVSIKFVILCALRMYIRTTYTIHKWNNGKCCRHHRIFSFMTVKRCFEIIYLFWIWLIELEIVIYTIVMTSKENVFDVINLCGLLGGDGSVIWMRCLCLVNPPLCFMFSMLIWFLKKCTPPESPTVETKYAINNENDPDSKKTSDLTKL